jgi:hypothetical protein
MPGCTESSWRTAHHELLTGKIALRADQRAKGDQLHSAATRPAEKSSLLNLTATVRRASRQPSSPRAEREHVRSLSAAPCGVQWAESRVRPLGRPPGPWRFRFLHSNVLVRASDSAPSFLACSTISPGHPPQVCYCETSCHALAVSLDFLAFSTTTDSRVPICELDALSQAACNHFHSIRSFPRLSSPYN